MADYSFHIGDVQEVVPQLRAEGRRLASIQEILVQRLAILDTHRESLEKMLENQVTRISSDDQSATGKERYALHMDHLEKLRACATRKEQIPLWRQYDLAERKIANDGVTLNDEWFDWFDAHALISRAAVVYHPDGKIKIVPEAGSLERITRGSRVDLVNISDNSGFNLLVLEDGEYETLRGLEFNQEDTVHYLDPNQSVSGMTQSEVMMNRLWRTLVPDETVLQRYVAHVFSQMERESLIMNSPLVPSSVRSALKPKTPYLDEAMKIRLMYYFEGSQLSAPVLEPLALGSAFSKIVKSSELFGVELVYDEEGLRKREPYRAASSLLVSTQE